MQLLEAERLEKERAESKERSQENIEKMGEAA